MYVVMSFLTYILTVMVGTPQFAVFHNPRLCENDNTGTGMTQK